jgi:hypothetical protein
MFKRGSLYYFMAGSGCCYCAGGGDAMVFVASDPLGPWNFQVQAHMPFIPRTHLKSFDQFASAYCFPPSTHLHFISPSQSVEVPGTCTSKHFESSHAHATKTLEFFEMCASLPSLYTHAPDCIPIGSCKLQVCSLNLGFLVAARSSSQHFTFVLLSNFLVSTTILTDQLLICFFVLVGMSYTPSVRPTSMTGCICHSRPTERLHHHHRCHHRFQHQPSSALISRVSGRGRFSSQTTNLFVEVSCSTERNHRPAAATCGTR